MQQRDQCIHRVALGVVGFNHAFLALGIHAQHRFELAGIAQQGNRLEMLIGFQQVVARIAAIKQAAHRAAGDNHRIHRQRRRALESAHHGDLRAVIRRHFTHPRIEQFAVDAFALQPLHNRQQICGVDLLVEQDRHHATFNGAARHRIQAKRCVFLQAVDVFRWGGMDLLIGEGDAQVFRHRTGQGDVDMAKVIHHALANIGAGDFTQLEAEGIDNMLLFHRRLALPEQARMGVVFTERRAALADFMPLDALLIRFESTAFRTGRGFARPVVVDGVWLVVRRVRIDIHAVHAVALEVVIRADRAVNRDLVKVWPTKTADLSIGIGEQAPLQQRVVGKVQTGDNMARMERRLFILGEEVIRVAV